MLGYNPSPGDAILPPGHVTMRHQSLYFLMPLHICPGLLWLRVTLSLLTHAFGSPPQLNTSHQGLGHVSSFNISSSQHFYGHSCEFLGEFWFLTLSRIYAYGSDPQSLSFFPFPTKNFSTLVRPQLFLEWCS